MCPAIDHCDFGYAGVGHLGQSVKKSGLNSRGKRQFNVEVREPCFIQLFNMKHDRYEISVTGNKIQAYSLHVTFPNQTTFRRKNEIVVSSTNDSVYVFVGTTGKQKSQAEI